MSTMLLLKTLARSFADDLASGGGPLSAWRLLRAARAMVHPLRSARLLQVLAQRAGTLQLAPRDLFFPLQQRHYLSRGLTPRQRIDAATFHYAFEASRFRNEFRHRVYCAGGLRLWHAQVGDAEFAVQLTPGNDNRCEGELSAVLYVDGERLSVTSFTYVDASIFGQAGEPIIFVTRTQSGREAVPHARFRAAFGQCSPPYFCLAAVAGIAIANGMHRLAGIRHDAHIACDAHNHGHLRNSYDHFWEAFHASPLDRQAFQLPVPMETTPLASLKAKHRRRAQLRRQAWAEVSASACAAIHEQLVGRPLPAFDPQTAFARVSAPPPPTRPAGFTIEEAGAAQGHR